MVQKKNTGLTSSFAGPKQTLSSLEHTRLNARNPKNNCKDNTNAPDNHVSERKCCPSLPHEAILGLNPMGVVKAGHSYALTIAEGGKLSEIAPIAPFPLDCFFTELAVAREEESSIRAKLQLPTVVPMRTDKQQPSQLRRSFSLSESDNFDFDLDDLLPLPSFRERNNGHVSCAKSMHNGNLSPHDTQYWQGHELPAEERLICTTPVMDRRVGVMNHFPHKRQRVGNSRHLAGSTAEKVKNVVAQKKLLERKKLTSMKLQPQLDRRKPPPPQQSYLQAKDYQHITPDTNVMSSGDSDSIISIRSEDDQWFKVLSVRSSGQCYVNKSLWSTTGFRPVNGEIFNVRNGISRETAGEVMKKMQNQSATTNAIPKKETLETPPSVMTSTGVSKESKMENEGAGGGMNNAQSSACHGAAGEVVRVRDQTSMEAISKEEMYEAPSTDDFNEHKVDNEKACEMINGAVNNNATHYHDTAGEGMKIDGETAVVTTPKPVTELGLTTANAPVVPSVINHIHVEAPTSTQTTLPSEVLSLLREMAEHQHTLAEAAKRQMEVLKQPVNKKSDAAELVGGTEPPPSIPMPAFSPPIVVVQPPPSSYHPITTQHKENISNNRNVSRLNTALASAVLAVSSRLDNIDSKVMERVIEAERMAQEALKESKDSMKKLTEATLESRFEKVCIYVAFILCVCE